MVSGSWEAAMQWEQTAGVIQGVPGIAPSTPEPPAVFSSQAGLAALRYARRVQGATG